MSKVFVFLLRLVLLLAGLLLAASLAVAVLLLAALWSLRFLWARLTGQPVTPFVMRVDPRTGFTRFYRGRQGVPRPSSETDAATPTRVQVADVTDVEAKPPRE